MTDTHNADLKDFLDRLASTPEALERVRELVNAPSVAPAPVGGVDPNAAPAGAAAPSPAGSTTTSSDPQRVTFTLPADAVDFLRSEAGRTGTSMADVLRRSLASEKYLQDVRKRGGDLLIEERGKPLMRLVFRE